MTNVIEVEGLTKTYRRKRGTTVALDGVDLSVPSGGVFGFLGPNGSGKTTTIRCLLGLARPTAGSMRLLGRPVPEGLGEAMRQTGAIVEAPALVPTMTGRRNLELLAAIDRIGPRRVDTVLDQVGLADRADESVAKYSLGMRQRLALAAAVLKEPALLMLDEPANGLDPAGMREVRGLLRALAAEGRTVFVSSHILAEIEQVCDRVAILSEGRCVAHGTVEQILRDAGRRPCMLARVADLPAGLSALRAAGLTVEVAGDALRVEIAPDDAAVVTQLLADAGLWVLELRPDRFSLEDRFLELTTPLGVEAAA